MRAADVGLPDFILLFGTAVDAADYSGVGLCRMRSGAIAAMWSAWRGRRHIEHPPLPVTVSSTLWCIARVWLSEVLAA